MCLNLNHNHVAVEASAGVSMFSIHPNTQRLISVISSPLWMNGNQLVKSASVESGWNQSPNVQMI